MEHISWLLIGGNMDEKRVGISDLVNNILDMLRNDMLSEGKSENEVKEFFNNETFPNKYLSIVETMAVSLVDSLTKYLSDDDIEDRQFQAQYRTHLENVWGEGFAWLRRYYSICLDICDEYNLIINESNIVSDKNNTANAIYLIHAKALQIYAEIICLIENGFPDGAYAHFRMLYEYWAVAEFLFHDMDEVSCAYLKSAEEKSNSELSHYKWAKKSKRFEDKDNITINNIVMESHKTWIKKSKQEVSNTHLKKLYTFPNYIIHPSAKGVTRRTSALYSGEIAVGKVDTGLATPAINSSMMMFNLTLLYFSLFPNSTTSVGIKILDKIVGNKIEPIFKQIEEQRNL